MPLTELLKNVVGVELSLRPCVSQKDKGGCLAKLQQPKSDLGLRFVKHKSGVRITHVLDNGAAMETGISANDVIIALDDIRVDINNAEKIIAATAANSLLKVHVFRRDELFEFSLTTKEPAADMVQLNLIEEAESAVVEQRIAWLGQ